MYFVFDTNVFINLNCNNLQFVLKKTSTAFKFVSLNGLHILRKDNQGSLQKIVEGLLIYW